MSQRNFPSADVDAATHRTTGHHHNLLCRVCGRAEDFVLGELEHHTERIAHQHRYIDLEHHIDLYGTCPDCAAANPLAEP
ncbi:transcriptional repressor [Nocardia sp. NPDC046763]|uniref:transcriptional repressor n=1 Tax=Nocardia sp. NPDC046763 TaxID=3155256 RepID=UPI0033C8B72B